MLLSPELRAELLATTREAAAALVEDLQHIREVLARENTSSAEIRRLSVVLRRILVDGDARRVAAPRVGKLMLKAPDNNPVYKEKRFGPPLFFLSGGAKVFGWEGSILAYGVAGNVTPQDALPQGWASRGTVDLALENFLAQRVLCYRGNWVGRYAAIKYVANYASGAHSDAPNKDNARESAFVLLAQIRSGNVLVKQDKGLHLRLMDHGADRDEMTFRYAPDGIDPVLIEVLSAAHYLAIAPMISDLETVIRDELSG